MNRILMYVVAGMCMTACSGNTNPYSGLQSELETYVAQKEDVRIGVAVIVNDTDTVAVNGDMEFPMLSVYKFPIAMAVAERCRRTVSDLIICAMSRRPTCCAIRTVLCWISMAMWIV